MAAEPAAEPAPAQVAETAGTATLADVAAEPAAEPAPAQVAETAGTATLADVAAEPAAEPAPAQVAETAETATLADVAAVPAAEPAPAQVAETAVLEEAPVADTRPEPTTMEELLTSSRGISAVSSTATSSRARSSASTRTRCSSTSAPSRRASSATAKLYGRNTESQPQLSVGDVVLVYVLQPESNEGHAVLSLRRAGLERKWRAMQEQFDEGVIIEAPVIDHNKGGLIVDCGIRGFVPISQIVDFPRRPQNEQPRDAAQEIAEKLQPYVGRELRLKILEVNRKANRLILSEKVALYEERREKRDELFSSLKVGQHVTGTVRSIAPFGVFVDLGGIDGLVHKSELSWNKVNNPEGAYGSATRSRPRSSISTTSVVGSRCPSVVCSLIRGSRPWRSQGRRPRRRGGHEDRQLRRLRARRRAEGLIHISELSHQRVAHPGDVVHEGQRIKLKVISLDSWNLSPGPQPQAG